MEAAAKRRLQHESQHSTALDSGGSSIRLPPPHMLSRLPPRPVRRPASSALLSGAAAVAVAAFGEGPLSDLLVNSIDALSRCDAVLTRLTLFATSSGHQDSTLCL